MHFLFVSHLRAKVRQRLPETALVCSVMAAGLCVHHTLRTTPPETTSVVTPSPAQRPHASTAHRSEAPAEPEAPAELHNTMKCSDHGTFPRCDKRFADECTVTKRGTYRCEEVKDDKCGVGVCSYIPGPSPSASLVMLGE